MMNPEDMTILVAAIFATTKFGWSTETCVHEAKAFVREAEHLLHEDRKTRTALLAADAAAVLQEGHDA